MTTKIYTLQSIDPQTNEVHTILVYGNHVIHTVADYNGSTSYPHLPRTDECDKAFEMLYEALIHSSLYK